ncbi:MAG: alpha-galactosidase [Clostridia bacterium]
MIVCNPPCFWLDTAHTSYVFRITPHGQLEHVYYGMRIPRDNVDSLVLKHTAPIGSTVAYGDNSTENYSLDTLCFEWSGIGCGDYRQPPLEAKMPDGSFSSDFIYETHTLRDGFFAPEALPGAYGENQACSTLTVTLRDQVNDVLLHLLYTTYDETDIITRRAILENNNEQSLIIRRFMSMQLDMENQDFSLVTFDGGWIHETHRHDRKLQYGTFISGSITGASSNRNNPGFLLYAGNATEDHGLVYGFNLIYSGNHMSHAELSGTNLVRIQLGIHPHCFEWCLHQGERFETPEAIMTCSDGGFNGMSAHFHDFINRHIVRGDWKGKERPVLINHWEAYFFQFTRRKLLRLARQAKKLGIELFVLDDGWFGARNSDTAGLGDYTINQKKLPRGMKHFSGQIHQLGMQFGLWFEPEMVNPDSDLYRAHPEYAIVSPGRKPTFGRNQLVLDLCNPTVRDYIVSKVGFILDDAQIDYVKWDMNRSISDAYSSYLANQGEFFHRYILGLYDVLTRIFRPRPQILLESCSSGGNRFDLGMLCFSPQVWSSDNTDPIERLAIQGGLSYLYPLSAMGAHVSAAPHQQTLRDTPLSTRFNVASFGCLGYELDLKYLTPIEKKEIQDQIIFYKHCRSTLQYGRFYRANKQDGKPCIWQCVSPDQKQSIAGFFQQQTSAAQGNDILQLTGLHASERYQFKTRPQRIFIRRFGGLLKHILPVELPPDGILLRIANRYFALMDCVETYCASGSQLMQGVRLNCPFLGTGYTNQIRMLGDFGSNLYTIIQAEESKS